MRGSADYQVLVVGAGPVGMTAAHELVRRGVAVRLIDKAAGPATTSRATANHARNLEVYHQMGLLDRALERGQRAENFSIHRNGRMLVRFGTDYTRLPTRFPFTLQLDQIHTEEILRDRLADFGVRVEWGVEIGGLTQDPRRVRAELRARGETERVEVPWLIGADGAHSFVRKSLGLSMIGDSMEEWTVADARLDVDLSRDSLHLVHVDGGTVLLVPFPTPRKWRLLDTSEVHEADGEEDYARVGERFERKLGKALRRKVAVETPSWVSTFTIQQRMIPRMQVARCFVAGDAAHVHSPASGQGMNTGMQDAHNLGWKLADVIRGVASPELLESYSAERVPVGETLLGSTKRATALIALRNLAAPVVLPIGLGLVNAVKPVKKKIERKILRGMSGLALHYESSPLALPARDGTAGIRPGHRVGCSAEQERAFPGWRELVGELTDPRWTLLGFAGPGERGDRIREALRFAEKHYGRAVSVRTVSANADDAQIGVLVDSAGVLAEGFGAREGDYVLVRPDGYLAGKGSAGECTVSLFERLFFRAGERENNPGEQPDERS
ncbi:FAD-dependent oxidoreductase [Amycolatopsis rubida]|uniref:FAD-dependent oxidoreductase n=1 Tax=Amycolatopsis rubida TaxID=112413 RepID=A0ABX0C873_9PSEU|nr:MULTISPECIES: FAD-dependent oxidoreductase [Amycolatopsis]MYW97969.1 FAD-dependent oxidoreductase [Amycolatopsis rubida]NEC62954.1 FAD-dependent oxidoreductase [Amycolatopsis rubida]OAP22622.1 Pentachlorophenol 4-monooxygenase [Amycolatopsis sp. M39]